MNQRRVEKSSDCMIRVCVCVCVCVRECVCLRARCPYGMVESRLSITVCQGANWKCQFHSTLLHILSLPYPHPTTELLCKRMRFSHMSTSLRFQSAFTSLTTPPPPLLLLVFSLLFIPPRIFLACLVLHSLPIPVSILPCPFICNPSVISLCVFMKYVCFGKYGFMHVCMLGQYQYLQ